MKKPNIILLFADDLGYGDISCLNENSKLNTPNIDRLASEGMICADAHASSALCTPSRYALLTGRYNWRSRLKSVVMSGHAQPLIEDGRLSLGSMFKKAGYQTGIVGKWHLGMNWEESPEPNPLLADTGTESVEDDRLPAPPGVDGDGPSLDRLDFTRPIKNGPWDFGFDYSYITPASNDQAPYVYIENGMVTAPPDRLTGMKDLFKYTQGRGFTATGDLHLNMTAWRESLTGADFDMMDLVPNTARRVLNLIDRFSSEDDPFFIHYPIHAPHTPCVPTPEFEGKSGVGPYGDMVLMIDDIVGRISAKLIEKGIADDTIFIVTSDNGSEWDFPQLGHRPSHIFRGYKSDIWEGGHRLPFIIRYPGDIEAGSRNDNTFCLVDFLATFADITGQKLNDNEGEDSFSVLPLWKGSSAPVRESTVHSSGRGYFAIRKGKWKLEMCSGSGGILIDDENAGTPPIQLYDMEADIRETTNVYDRYPDVVRELTKELTDIVVNGRSTPGTPQKNTGPERWPQLNWMK